MSKNKLYVQFGCGLSAPKNWMNFDASPTLILQKTPILGILIKGKLNAVFPSDVRYGDIIKELPGVGPASCKGIYCSHILEHLSLGDLRKALLNTHMMMKEGGIFRLVVPDLEYYLDQYHNQKDENSAMIFMESTILGMKERKRGLKGVAEYLFGNSKHLWMWDFLSMKKELESVGFEAIRKCKYGDCEDKMFLEVENPARFRNALAIECRKGS